MALKNSQYDAILREYNQRQLNNVHEQEERIKKVYEQIPEFQKIDEEISSLSVAHAKRFINGDDEALTELKAIISQLSQKRRSLLTVNGYPQNYLELHPQCPICKDTGYVNNQKCQCFKQACIEMLYTSSNLKEILQRENFGFYSYDYYSENYVDTATGLTALSSAKRAVTQVRHFIETFDTEFNNLFLYGNTGVGKTFLSNCIAKELMDSSHSVVYFTSYELFDVFAKKTFEQNAEAADMNDYIFDCDLLIVDDLGAELTNSFVSSQLFLCINERIIRKKSTIISTNLALQVFIDTYSERTFSRISSNYTMVKLVGEDIRLKKKKPYSGKLPVHKKS